MVPFGLWTHYQRMPAESEAQVARTCTDECVLQGTPGGSLVRALGGGAHTAFGTVATRHIRVMMASLVREVPPRSIRLSCPNIAAHSAVSQALLSKVPHLADGEGFAAGGVVDREVEACAEEVLVRLRVDSRGHDRAVARIGRVLIRRQRIGRQLASQLDLVLDRAVLRTSTPQPHISNRLLP